MGVVTELNWTELIYLVKTIGLTIETRWHQKHCLFDCILLSNCGNSEMFSVFRFYLAIDPPHAIRSVRPTQFDSLSRPVTLVCCVETTEHNTSLFKILMHAYRLLYIQWHCRARRPRVQNSDIATLKSVYLQLPRIRITATSSCYPVANWKVRRPIYMGMRRPISRHHGLPPLSRWFVVYVKWAEPQNLGFPAEIIHFLKIHS